MFWIFLLIVIISIIFIPGIIEARKSIYKKIEKVPDSAYCCFKDCELWSEKKTKNSSSVVFFVPHLSRLVTFYTDTNIFERAKEIVEKEIDQHILRIEESDRIKEKFEDALIKSYVEDFKK